MSNAAEAKELIGLYLERYGEVPMLFDVKSLRKWHRDKNFRKRYSND